MILEQAQKFGRAILLVAGLAQGASSLAAPAPAPATTPATPAEAPAPAPPEITPIPEADIPEQGASLMRLLAAYRRRLQPSPEIEVMALQVEAFESRLEPEFSAHAERPLSGETLFEIEDLNRRWQRRKEEVQGWQATLRARARELAQLRDELAAAKAVWQKTRDTAVPGSNTLVLVDHTLAEIEAAERVIRERLDPILALDGRLVRRGAEIDEAMDDLGQASTEARRRLLRVERPPLWKIFRDPQIPALGTTLAEVLRSRAAELAEYLAEQRTAILFQAILFVILVGVIRLRPAPSAAGADDPGMRVAAKIRGRPVSAALAIALLPSSWLYAHRPVVFMEGLALLTLLPMVRLLPPLLALQWSGRIYALAGIFLIFRLERLTVSGSPGERLLLLVATVAAAVWLWVTWRSLASRGAEGWGRWKGLVTLVVRVGFLLLAVALVANLAGAVSLAALLARAVGQTIYLGLVLFAAGKALDAALALLTQTPAVRQIGFFGRHALAIAQWRARLVNTLVLLVWTRSALNQFRVWDAVAGYVTAALEREWTAGTLSISLGHILTFVLAIWLATLVSRLTRFVLREEVLPHFRLPRGVPQNLSMLAHYVILGLGLLVAVSAAGLELSKLAFIVGALGVGIGFGLQSLVNNFVSGLILIFERPISIGDTVEMGTTTGVVRRIGIRASVLQTFEGAEVIVPNGNLLAAEVINWTLSDRRRRVDVPLGVAYGTDPQKVIELLGAAVGALATISREPAPQVLFNGFGDSALNFTVRFWTDDFDNWVRVRSEVVLSVHRALTEAGIEIPFPQRDLHLRSVDAGVERFLGGAAPARDPDGRPAT